MKYLKIRILSQFGISEEYQLTASIKLIPSNSYQYPLSKKGWVRTNSFYFTEEFADGKIDYKNLKDFIAFWALVTNDTYPVKALRDNVEVPEILDELSSFVAERDISRDMNMDPSNCEAILFPNRKSFSKEIGGVFNDFQNIEPEMKHLLNFFHETGCVQSSTRYGHETYDNYLMGLSLNYFIIDALVPEYLCTGKTTCDICDKAATRHSTKNLRERIAELVSPFGEQRSIKYSNLLMEIYKKRNLFVHQMKQEDRPQTQMPTLRNEEGQMMRSVSLDETIQDFGKEGLATHSAEITLRDIIWCLLLNKIFPMIDYWPEFGELKMVSGSIRPKKSEN